MSVFRVHKTNNYTVMSNTHLRCKEMSLKAKGLLSVMLSLPDEWHYSIEGLVAMSKESTDAIKSTLKELQEFGYVYMSKKMPNETKSGRYEYEYDIYEVPQKTRGEKQGVEFQAVEKQEVEFQAVENPALLNTNKVNTNKENTNKEITNKESIVDLEQIDQIVQHLNNVTGKHFRSSTEKTKKLIRARLKEGFSADELMLVASRKAKQWRGDNKMDKFLRPETLYGNKFESYLNEKDNARSDRIKNAVRRWLDDEEGTDERNEIVSRNGLY